MATATKTSLKKWIRAASYFSPLFVKCLQFFLELSFKGLYQSSGKEKESCCLVFPSSTKREIRHFHVVVVQRRLRNVQKSVMHVPSCCFANINLLPFWRSRCRRRRQKRYQHFPVALRHESEKITWSVNLAIERFHSRTLQLCQY